MSQIGHSTLLKFFVNTSKMSEQPPKTDSTIESKVPGEQTLRGDYVQEMQNENCQEDNAAMKEFSLSPIIKVTKEESTFTKGDLKLQKVIVSEDISDETETTNTILTVTNSTSPTEVQTEVHGEVSSVTINTDGDTQTSTGEQKVVYKVTKIPKLKFRQAVDKIKKEEAMMKEGKDEATLGLNVTEVIPILKDEVILQVSKQTEQIKEDSPKVDDEFDKIYDEICENGPPSGNFPSAGKIEDPDKLETKFEEIIHAYDEQKVQTTNGENIKSRIPLLKRKSEQDIFAIKQTIRRHSLKKLNSIDDAKCKLPVPKEKQNVENESHTNNLQNSQNQSVIINSKTVSAKNVTVIETVNTNVSKTITTTFQKSSDKYVTQETKSNSISELSKSKIPTQLKKIVAVEKTSDIQTSKISSQLSIEKRSEDKFINLVNKNDTHEPETSITKDTNNLRATNNISNIKTEPLITDNVEKIPNSNDNNEKDNKLNITIVNETKNKQATDIEIKSHVLTKTEYSNLEPVNILTQNEKPIDATNSNNDCHETNKNTENNVSKPEEEKMNVNETNTSVPISQKIRETVRIVSLEFSNSETINIENDKQDKTNDNITNIPKDILQVSAKDVYSETNAVNNNSIQEPKHDENKTKLNEVNIQTNEVISNDRESTTNLTERVNLNIKFDISEDVSRSINEINNNNHQYSINKLESESTQKSLETSDKTVKELSNTESNKEIINSFETKEDNAILLTNQHSEAKVERQEIAMEVTKNLTSQEYSSKSENISKIISTEANNNNIQTEVIKESKVIAITNNGVESSENNEKNITEMEEEDIIILKGKVNRIINRLDSKEFTVNKYEADDVPRKVSVVSKIALFEQSKSIEQTNKTLTTKIKHADEIILNKPIIVDGVLKIDNESLKGDSKFSYDTFLNYKNSIKNNIRDNEKGAQAASQTKTIKQFDKIFKTYINLNEFNKSNENKTGCFEDDVFLKKEESDRNIINTYKINKEIDLDLRRVKSLAEANFDGIRGRVRQMVVRMNSIDKMALERRELNEVRKKTRQGSVSERIAVLERDANEQDVHLMKKIKPVRMESISTSCSPNSEEVTSELKKEELTKRISELTQARMTYGPYGNMTFIELRDGGRLPTLAIGTALLDSQLVKPIIKSAIDLGYRAIDTAYIYGNEQAVGEAIREKIQDGTVKREELFVLSKLWSTNHRRDLVPRACRQSLDVMGLDYFDLYLIHNPMSFKEGPNPIPKIANVLQYSAHDYLEAWFGIEGLIKQGLVKRGGVSNFNSVQMERVLDKGKIEPVINQVECHPYLSQTRLQDYLSTRGVMMSCFGCLGSSGTPQEYRSSLTPVIQDPLVRTMAAGLGITPAQLLISYQVSLGRSVVVKASSAAHLWDNLQALDLYLAPEHIAALGALNRNKRTFTFEGMGDTHKNYPFNIPF